MNILLVTFGILGIVYCRRHHKKHKTDVDYDMCVPKGDYATKADLKKIVRNLLEIKVLQNQMDVKGPQGRNGVRGAEGESENCCEYYSHCLRRTRDSVLKGKTKSYKFMGFDKAYWHEAYLKCLQNNMTLAEPRNAVDYAEIKKFSSASEYSDDGDLTYRREGTARLCEAHQIGIHTRSEIVTYMSKSDTCFAWTGITTFENGIFFNRVSDGEPLTYADWYTGYPKNGEDFESVTYSTWDKALFHNEPRTNYYFFCEQWS